MDNGETWTMLSDDHCYSLLINSVGLIYSIQSGDLKRSFDNGDSWELVRNGSNGICIDEDDNIFCAKENKIYKSIDDGENWSLFIDGIQDGIHKLVKNQKGDLIIKTYYNQLLILPKGSQTTSVLIDRLYHGGIVDNTDLYIDNEDNIYLLQENEGILFSADNGNNWTELNSGIEDLFVRCIVQNVDGYLFIGTNDGIYRSKNPITSIKENTQSRELPNNVNLSQNYPNPFNPVTTIKYNIPLNERREKLNVKIIVYDILGKEVATLVNKKQKPGNYEVNWNAINVPSGIYLYRLRVYSFSGGAGDFAETKKMILLK